MLQGGPHVVLAELGKDAAQQRSSLFALVLAASYV